MDRPRYWINLVPTGGVDAIYTTDPRITAEVAGGVDVPYREDQIASGGGLRLGPTFAALTVIASRLTILNGVLVRTANHYTGIEQQSRLRTHTTMRTPGVFDIIGAHRDSQALAHVRLNTTLRQAQTAGFFGGATQGDFGGGLDVFGRLEALTPEQQHDLAGMLDTRLRSFRRAGAGVVPPGVVDSVRQVRDYLTRAAELPRFTRRPWTGSAADKDETDSELEIGTDLQRALWLIENDLASAVTVFAGNFEWDSHFENARSQTKNNAMLARSLLRLFAALEERSNRHGKLLDQTVVIVGSEIGRFPYLNQAKGKDHYPQIPMLFGGWALRGGRQLGSTGKQLEALPVSLATGKPTPSGKRVVLDDVGYTLLELAGITPESFAFGGSRLSFLVEGAT